MRSKFDEQLALLNDMLIEMGAMIENAITIATSALVKLDADLANEAMQYEEEIDLMEKKIEDLCMRLLLHHHPVARDLRMISSALKMITDMERIGDHAADISEITLVLLEHPYVEKLELIPQMAEATAKMVTESIDAYVKMDLSLAEAVIKYDDVVDDLFNMVKTKLMEQIRSRGNGVGEHAIDLIMIAKYFERIGDHATNIAEWVVYSITGSRWQKPGQE